MKTEFTIKHSTYMMTIAELIEAIEQITEAKVTQITETGELLTFKVEWPQPIVQDDLIEEDQDNGLIEYYDYDVAEDWIDPHEY